ncbi:integral peroxisomal membrane peroxin-domain-containing protein [Circinella umbellata]|nr:integral peroxisomal membrane peroxin-domain-containing protein [Circinella umbellata]
MPTSHSFKPSTFFSPTYCQYCSKLLWGLIQQGVQCSECNYVVHHHCQKNVSAECQTISHQLSKETSAEKSLLNNLQQECSEPQSSSLTITSSSSDNNNKININNALKQLQELIILTALDVSSDQNTVFKQYSSEYLANQPPLHPHTTAKNFTRFVTRCTIVFNLRDAIILLVCWDKPVKSWISILIYTLLCLYPKLFLLIPQCILLYLILSHPPQQEQNNISSQDNASSKDINRTTTDQINNDHSSNINSNDSSDKKKKTTDQQQQTPSPKTTASTTSTFLSLLTNSNNNTTTPTYKNNLKNIQNMMGEFALVYDQLIHYYNKYYSMLNQEICIQIVLLSISITVIFLWFIPLHWIFLSIGWFVFAIHTRFVKTFLTRLIETRKDLLFFNIIKDWMFIPFQEWYIINNKQSSSNSSNTIKELTISIYENQRKSNENFIKDEIIPWSNLYGIPQPSPNQERDSPKGYYWKCKDWKIDTTGPWIDDALQIAVRPKKEEGWIYMDENWTNPKSEPYQQSIIRRRRWIRNCELKM